MAAGVPTTIAPRLMNLHQAAAYLGLSFWTVRDYALQGLIPVVTLPALAPREGERPRETLRRVLVDRNDLDTFVERCKGGHSVGTAARFEAENTGDLSRAQDRQSRASRPK
jgi:hypothetical protein